MKPPAQASVLPFEKATAEFVTLWAREWGWSLRLARTDDGGVFLVEDSIGGWRAYEVGADVRQELLRLLAEGSGDTGIYHEHLPPMIFKQKPSRVFPEQPPFEIDFGYDRAYELTEAELRQLVADGQRELAALDTEEASGCCT